jgi:hypothetical protein
MTSAIEAYKAFDNRNPRMDKGETGTSGRRLDVGVTGIGSTS